MNKRLTYFSVLLFLIIGMWLAQAVSWRQAALFAIGGALGIVLYHAQFGFTSAYRVFIADRRGAGIRAQMGMLALACLLFFPALNAGFLFDIPLRGSIEQISLSLFVGAFLFGIGMQLGSGCASGTLYTVGGGKLFRCLGTTKIWPFENLNSGKVTFYQRKFMVPDTYPRMLVL